ncbi:MAG: hypothetical protein KJ955_01065 [Nanoarchaeota archaeon]|nr:hypothetical protein [Nanoarchaeota archaeon]
MSLLNKIGKGMALAGLIGAVYTCNFPVPKPLLDNNDTHQYSNYRQHPDYYWVTGTFEGVFVAGGLLTLFTEEDKPGSRKKKEKKEE